MVEHSCVKCNKSFTRKDAYNKHLSRKISCIAPVYENVQQSNHNIIMELLQQQMAEITILKLKLDILINEKK